MYEYDDTVHTYIVGIGDSFGYTSSSQINYRYGQPLVTVNTNRHSMLYSYDRFGRLTRVVGPYDVCADRPTIACTYAPAMLSNFVYV